MPIYPGAQKRLISANFDYDAMSPRYVILHIIQGTLAGADSWFRDPAAQASAHFGVGKDGTVYQWVDTRNRAWHCAEGNSVAIGIEHEGYSGERLTDAQISADAGIVAWARTVHGIPLRITDNPSGSSGLGWHGMGGAAWGNHPNCPGAPIVHQRQDILDQASGQTTGIAEDLMNLGFLFPGKDADGNTQNTPIVVVAGKTLRLGCNVEAKCRVDFVIDGGHQEVPSVDVPLNYSHKDIKIPGYCSLVVVHRPDGGSVPVSFAVL